MSNYELDAQTLIENEVLNYETASREIRDLLKRCRKNYANKFEQPYTSLGRKKTFIPLTRWEVDTIVPKIFVNDKAVTVVPENEEAVRASFIADKTLKYQIRRSRFPTYFKNSIYDLGIDGTVIYAIYWDFERQIIEKKGIIERIKKFFGKNSAKTSIVKKDQLGFKQIDVLDCFIDPTADSIQDAQSFIYRSVVTLDSVKRNPLYNDNKYEVKGFTRTISNYYDSRSTYQYDVGSTFLTYEQPMVAIYERWGRIKLAWITGNKNDEDVLIDGVITLADLNEGDKPYILRIDKNPFDHGMKPFEECWYQKKQGRWYGIGIAEKILEIQEYYNRTVNRRIENEDVLHSGLFKVKRGSGITAKQIVSAPGGIIEVDNMNDVEQLQLRDISVLSDGTIRLLNDFVERINGASEIATGSATDRSATTSLIKDRNADTRFAAVRGYVNDFLLRFFTQVLALDRQYLDKKFVLRVTGDEEELRQIDRVLGTPPEMRDLLPQYRFISVDPDDIRQDFDLEVDIDQSIPMNKAENAQRVLQAIELGKKTQIQGVNYTKLYQTYLDLIGINGNKYREEIPMQAPIEPGGGMASSVVPSTELETMLNANGFSEEQQNAIPSTSGLPKAAAM